MLGRVLAATIGTVGIVAAVVVPASSDETPAPEPVVTSTPSPAVAEPETTTSAPEPEPSAAPSAEPTKAAAPSTTATEPAATPTETTPTPSSGGRLLVFGDSTSAWFSDQPGSPSQGWWSKVAAKAGMEPVLSAESGSGMWARGNKCGGTRFDQRLSEIARTKPSKIIVATGRNDYHRCVGGQGQGYVTSPRAQVEKAISNYMTKLERAVKDAGLDPKDVYVTTPWGTDGRSVHVWMWKAQKREAEKRKFNYVTVRFLDDKHTLDRTHPNAAGNELFAKDFLRVSRIAG
jgi:lysophospholipase L1-like esterase